jgi:GT2 family glycosyltransferase
MRRIEPILTDDLVIAARDRAREPELPEATLARALATPITPKLARYDVIIISDGPESRFREERLAAEFARHEHQVFFFADHLESGQRPTPPALHRLPWPPGASEASALLDALATLRQTSGIEAAAVFLPLAASSTSAREIRTRWGWRIVSEAVSSEPLQSESDVLVAFDTTDGEMLGSGVVALPPSMSWPSRWATLDRAVRAAWPKASIVVLTHDNLAFNRLCLASVLENTEYPNYELLVVDNASSDGTVEELRRLAGFLPHMRLVQNDHNAGFGPGNNQGLAATSGDICVLLNNDTIVPRGWLTRLVRHLEDRRVGLLGPATNRTCNEAQVDFPYQTYAEFQSVARLQAERHEREQLPIRMLAMFCCAFRRETYERLGPLDERYEVGMFEDEDYALRVKEAGLDVVWTPEVYIHHAYHASIGKLLPSGEYMRLVRLNQGRFEEKWGICWERHRPIPTPATS